MRIIGASENKGQSNRIGNMIEKHESENGLWCRIKLQSVQSAE